MILFELLDIIQGEGLGGGDIHRAPQEIGQRRGRCTHHLVHDLADGADGQLIELEFLIRGFAAHEDIHDHLHIAPFEQHDVAAFQAGYIFDLNGDSRLQITNAEFLHRHHRYRRSGDIHPVIQQIGYRRG